MKQYNLETINIFKSLLIAWVNILESVLICLIPHPPKNIKIYHILFHSLRLLANAARLSERGTKDSSCEVTCMTILVLHEANRFANPHFTQPAGATWRYSE